MWTLCHIASLALTMWHRVDSSVQAAMLLIKPHSKCGALSKTERAARAAQQQYLCHLSASWAEHSMHKGCCTSSAVVRGRKT